jgi:hypothetical protein
MSGDAVGQLLVVIPELPIGGWRLTEVKQLLL